MPLSNFPMKVKYIFKDFIYLRGGGAEAEGEAGSPLSREPDVELNPRTPGS